MRGFALLAVLGACYRDGTDPTTAPGTSAPAAPSSLIGATRPASYSEVQAVAISRLIPQSDWPQVPRRTVGVVYAMGPQAWGTSINNLRGFDDKPDEEAYRFSREGASGYTVIWRTRRIDRHAYVAELKVDGGNELVVHTARVLDRTDAVWFDTEDVLRQLRKRFEATVAVHTAELAAAMNESHGKLENDKRERLFGAMPTWLGDERQLEVLFVVRDDHSGTTYGYGATTRHHDPTLFAHPPPPEPMLFEHGAAMAARYTVDAHGKLVGETVYLPASYTAHRGGGYDYGRAEDDWYGR